MTVSSGDPATASRAAAATCTAARAELLSTGMPMDAVNKPSAAWAAVADDNHAARREKAMRRTSSP